MTEHYYTENPTSEINEKQFTYNGLTFTSVSGVFGFSTYVDKASQLLIENFDPSLDPSLYQGSSSPSGQDNTNSTAISSVQDGSAPRVLDLGCGFGAIGLSVKHMYPSSDVHMTDINNRAVEYATINAKSNRLGVTLHSGNLHQIFTYVKNKDTEFGDQPHKFSGMLLYAATDEAIQPDNSYQMSGNKISVKTLDLNKDFPEIAAQLNAIVDDHFG